MTKAELLAAIAGAPDDAEVLIDTTSGICFSRFTVEVQNDPVEHLDTVLLTIDTGDEG